MSEDFQYFSDNEFSYELNLPFSQNKPTLKIDDINDERIEDKEPFFNKELPYKLFEDGDENPLGNIILADTFFTTKKRNFSKDLLFNDSEEKKDEGEEENDIKREEIGQKEDKEKESNQMHNDETVIKKKSSKGRKSFDDEGEGKHTKDSEDNMFRKIKSFFVGSYHDYLNSTIQDPELQLTKVDFYICKEIKKDFNESLFAATLKKIYETVNLSDKYSNLIKNEPDKNRKIIEKIFNENKEVEAIKTLNLTFDEVYQIFISRYCPLSSQLIKKIEGTNILTSKKFLKLDDFLKYIREKFEKEKEKKKNQTNIDGYISKIKNLCLNLKKWFQDKNGRKNRIEIKYKF